MTDSAISPAATNWQAARPALQERYPAATPGILFCVFKLQQDPSLTIPDFRQEAQALGLALGGRALRSARVLLGLTAATPARAKARKRAPARAPLESSVAPLEDDLIRAVQRMQAQSVEQAHRLRTAMRKAVQILEQALEE